MGCFPLYPPLELFFSMNLQPFILWGLKTFFADTHRSDEHIPDYVCSINRHLVEFILSDYGMILDGMFFYNACDCLRNTPEIVKEGLNSLKRDVQLYNFHIPMNSLNKDFTKEYLEREISLLIKNLECFTDEQFSFKNFKNSVRLYRKMRILAKELEKVIIQKNLSYSLFVKVINELNYLDVRKQIQVLNSHIKRIKVNSIESKGIQSNRVIISGIMPPPINIIKIMEDLNLKIVGNDIAFLSRFLSYTPKESTFNSVEIYYNHFYKNHFPCTTLLYTADSRIAKIIELVKDLNVDGVILIGEKFCEYEYFEFPTLQEALKSLGIPTLLLEFSIEDTLNFESYKTRIQAFQEVLNTNNKR